ncbi:MAG: hypothetical protein WD768_21315 [Phycisphaeraceae bacterium]
MTVRLPLAILLTMIPCASAATPTRDDALAALKKACTFMAEKVARNGGYFWRVSGDLKHSEGEGSTGDSMVWVQPPGTPSIGEALLDAYDATGDAYYLKAATRTGEALLHGQLHSGGWGYFIEFDPEKAKKFDYLGREFVREIPPLSSEIPRIHVGWDSWKMRKNKGNVSTNDDDTTQSATRFMIRLDEALAFKDKRIHSSADYALDALCRSQYPAGGWSHNWDQFPLYPIREDFYPVKKASLTDDWQRTWPKTFAGCYITNDNLMSDMIDMLARAHRVYKNEYYMAAAKKAGDFLILAQLPDPQPAWAQQYNKEMQPEWSRAFEPPSVTGGESQSIMRTLIKLYRLTGEKKYLEPIPKAIAYLRTSLRPDGRLARFYEMNTNRPIYFNYDKEGRHQITYSDKDLPTHYGWIVDSKLDSIEKEYQAVLKLAANELVERKGSPRMSTGLAKDTAAVIAAMDERGAWVEPGRLKSVKGEQSSGVIESRTFIRHIETLCDFVRASK